MGLNVRAASAAIPYCAGDFGRPNATASAKIIANFLFTFNTLQNFAHLELSVIFFLTNNGGGGIIAKNQKGEISMKPKKKGLGLEMKIFESLDGKHSYLVFRTLSGSFHVFVEVEAKKAALECGAERGNQRQMWQNLWRRR